MDVNIEPTLMSSHLQGTAALGSDVFENRVIEYVMLLSQRVWLDGSAPPRQVSRHMSLLHLAAALGYTQLIQALRKWR